MKNKPTITVGIPAFNEEANIGELISDLLIQDDSTFNLKRIIVSSDGSTDKTTSVVNAVRDKRVTLMDNKSRKGLGRGLNQIVKETNSEILVLADADISIKDKLLLSKLINPIIKGEYELTSCKIEEEMPRVFLEKCLYVSMRLKDNLFDSFKGGNNLFSCHGLMRGMSRNMYKKIYFPEGKGNDIYTYLYAKKNGYKYMCVKNASVLYRLPGSMLDHKKQSLRFYTSLRSQEKYFSKKLIERETNIPLTSYIAGAIKSTSLFVRYPFNIVFYVLLNVYLKSLSLAGSGDSAKWGMAKSTKYLRI